MEIRYFISGRDKDPKQDIELEKGSWPPSPAPPGAVFLGGDQPYWNFYSPFNSWSDDSLLLSPVQLHRENRWPGQVASAQLPRWLQGTPPLPCLLWSCRILLLSTGFPPPSLNMVMRREEGSVLRRLSFPSAHAQQG